MSYTHITKQAIKKLLKPKIQVAVQSLAGSGRLLLRPRLVALVEATHYAEDTTQEEELMLQITIRNVIRCNTNIIIITTRHRIG